MLEPMGIKIINITNRTIYVNDTNTNDIHIASESCGCFITDPTASYLIVAQRSEDSILITIPGLQVSFDMSPLEHVNIHLVRNGILNITATSSLRIYIGDPIETTPGDEVVRLYVGDLSNLPGYRDIEPRCGETIENEELS